MLNQINKKIKFLKTLVSAIVGVSSLYIIDSLSSNFGEALSVIFLIILVVLVSMVFEAFLLGLINKSERIRRVISGREFIEGIWIDKTVDPNDVNKIITISIFKIFYEDGEIKYHGEIFDENGNTAGTFRSTSTRYDTYKLFSSYEAKIVLPDYSENNISGFTEYVFVVGKKYPESFHGIAIDNLEGKRRVIEAIRLLNNEALGRIDNQEYRKNFILKILGK